MIQATCKHAGGKLCDREDPCSPLCQGEFISKNVLKWYLFMTVSKCHVMRLPKNLIFNSGEASCGQVGKDQKTQKDHVENEIMKFRSHLVNHLHLTVSFLC